jgi:hypothetical protein
MMEAESTSETSVNFYQTTRRKNPEYSHLHTRRRENLKSHQIAVSPELAHFCPSQYTSLESFPINTAP